MKKNIRKTCFLALLTVTSWAAEDLPEDLGVIDPPPDTVPIDSFLTLAIIMALVVAAYFINRRQSSPLNNK
jgi:hypothetical protein